MLTELIQSQDKQRDYQKLQRVFKDKVFIGLSDEPLKRKVYRSKRDSDGHRHNEIYYVNEKQDFRISEKVFLYYVNEILCSLKDIEDVSFILQNQDSKKEKFYIEQSNFLDKKPTINEYKEFMSSQLSNDDNQSYLNELMVRRIRNNEFKDIIEKIEIYETGIVCILNNGFELSVRF